jgi:DNA segregation ATPase FtsK/SpoIIIE-like protein
MSLVSLSLPERAMRLLDEARWFANAGAGFLLALILLTYDRADPGWSNAGPPREIHNAGGRVGAWLADLLLYLFGASTWIWVGLIAVLLWRGILRMRAREMSARGVTPTTDPEAPHFAFERWLGFTLFFLGCVGLESHRLYSLKMPMPLAPGGVAGDLIADGLTLLLGPVGTTMVLLGFIAIGFSLLSGWSWFEIFERIGGAVERVVGLMAEALAVRQDRAIGQQAALERDGLVDEKKLKVRSADGLVEDFLSTAPDSGSAAAPRPRRASAPEFNEPQLAGLFEADDQALDLPAGDHPAGDHPASDHPAGVFAEGAAHPDSADLSLVLRAERGIEGDTDLEPVLNSAPPATQPAPPSALKEPASSFRIEPQAPPAEKSVRVLREAQKSLFGLLEGSDPRPSVALLEPPPAVVETVSPESISYTSRLIEKKLADFGVAAKVVTAQPGPVITRYEIEPATGVKGSQIVNLGKDLARALSLTSLRVVETIPGKNVMGLELPNARRQTVRLSEILSAKVFADASSALTMALGKDISGHAVVADLARMPHLLVAGTTGSGKSVGINAMLLSLLYKSDPAQVRLILIDPKMLEMSVYEGIPHLLAPVVTDMRQAANALNWCVAEMERRYRIMSKLGVRNLAGFNTKIAEAAQRETLIPNPFSLTPDAPEPLGRLPQIVVVIDELADLMMVVGKKIEELIARLAQKARAAGIHLILATQRPSVDVITGLIKANIPTRIAFQVSSKIDSRTILDQMGAESLLGMGDMLYLPPGSGVPMRVHGAFVADEEVHRVVEHWKAQGDPDYIEGLLEGGVVEAADTGSAVGFGGLSQTLSEAGVDAETDPMYDQAVGIVLQNRRASISLVQRHLRIGYNRAARLLEQMEKSGVVSAMATNGNRDVLVPARNE